MPLKLSRGTGVKSFMNRDILFLDFKFINLDRVLTNLFVKMYADGRPVVLAYRKEYTIDVLKENLKTMQSRGSVRGVADNMEGVEDWLRSSLLELVNRGNVVKEHIATLKPLHLLSFRVQNKKFCRDYMAADQLYLMLKSNPEIMDGLVQYLSKGWDKNTDSIVRSEDLDVDTMGILYLTSPLRAKIGANSDIETIPRPFLPKQAELFNDDIKRLLLYRDKLPRVVFIDYLRILCGLHLTLYVLKVVYLLPKMLEKGSEDVEDDWSMIVDMTNDLDSIVSPFACRDFKQIENGFGKYIRATYAINLIQKRRDCSVERALEFFKDESNHADAFYESDLKNIRSSLPEKSESEFDQIDFDEMVGLFPEDDYFGRLVHVLEKSNLGLGQNKYLRQFVDTAAMKNSTSMLLADSRSKRHPRRGVIGSKLLETMVQLLVIQRTADGGYETRSLSIEDLASEIRSRYGLIISGAGEPRFADEGVDLNAAFRANMDAFKDKLRQIGFYTDMSDACILQRIRPRYKL